MSAVANSSPLIHLSAIGDIDLLPRIMGPVTIPEAVYQEVVIIGRGQSGEREVRQAQGNWLTVAKVQSRAEVERLMNSQGLHLGESEAIILAQEISARMVLLDDQRAVVYARSCGLRVIRTPAVYTTAKALGLIGDVRHKLDQLRVEGFHLKQTDYEAILKTVGKL